MSERFALDTGANGPPETLTTNGLFADAAVLVASGTPPERAVVRPVVVDGAADWMRAVAESLDAHKGSRMAVAAKDQALAAQIAAGAAAAVGDAGLNAVLVDGCVERPALEKALHDDGDEGLVDAVLFDVSAELVARRTLASGVRLVTAGSYPLSVVRVLESQALGRFLDNFRRDVVILVVPETYVELVAPTVTDIVVVGRNPDELLEIGRKVVSASERLRLVAVLVEEKPPPPLIEEVDGAGARASSESGRDAGEGAAPAPRAEGAACGPTSGTAGERPEFPGRRVEVPHVVETRAVIASARPMRRRRPRAPWILLAAALTAVGIWMGLGGGRRAVTPSAPVQREEGIETAGRAPGRAETPVPSRATGADAGAARDEGREVPRGASLAADTTSRDLGRAQRQPSTGATVAAWRPGPGGRYVIYLSSHRTHLGAEIEAGAASKRGLPVEIVEAQVGDTGTWYRLELVGAYPTLAEARAALAEIRGLGYDGAWLARVSEGD